jgi:hypothetical protein
MRHVRRHLVFARALPFVAFPIVAFSPQHVPRPRGLYVRQPHQPRRQRLLRPQQGAAERQGQRWQGFLCFLLRALDKVPRFQGTVYRGGNAGLDQAAVRREYTMGRPVQWAAFSSTTKDLAAAKRFVDKRVGVLFKLTVVSGRDIVAYSYFPKENEILLSPNTRLTVASELYVDKDGFSCMDLTETAGPLLQS